MEIVFTGHNLTEAHIVAGMLRAHDIDAHVGGHYLQGGVGDMAALDFAKVYVGPDDLDHARRLIADYEGPQQEDADAPPAAPAPDAADAAEPEDSRWSLAQMAWLLAAFVFLFLLSWAA